MAASRVFVPLTWLHVPVIAVIAFSNGVPMWRPALLMALAAVVATVAVWRGAGNAATRTVVAGALTFAPILMVYVGAGPWEVDWHMYFFVIFGILVAYVDWLPIVIATVLTAAQHVLLSVLFPAAAFPDSDGARVVLHGGIVLADALVLLWIVRQMHGLFVRIAQSNAMLETRIVERTAEVTGLNTTLALKVSEMEHAMSENKQMEAERQEVAVRLDHLAHHDLITGLPNRVLLMDRLGVALATARRAGTGVLIFYLDLADFKQINDTNGHAAGDRALSKIAAKLRGCMRTGDTASRVGGDEFVIVCSTQSAVSESSQIAERLLEAAATPILLGHERVRLEANVGISLFPADGDDPDELIRKADAAMYRAKQSGRNTFHFYTPEIHEAMLAKSTLKRDLEAALERNEFVVFYQPVVSLKSRSVIGAEALVRWQHPERGLLPPSEFIAFAEEHGLITGIGEAVLDKACAQVKRFAFRPDDQFTMAVNVSAIQFREAGFVDRVLATLATHDMSTTRLEVEITESIVMHEAEAVIATLHNLESHGVRLSIDDFGTGYSSLAYVKNFPVHTLKIDRSFVNDLAENSTDQAIAATIITLAHNLGMRVIAEGIETEEQLAHLRILGADDIQGYLISRPLPAADFERFVCSFGAVALAA